MNKFAVTYLSDGIRHERSAVANTRDEALSQFLATDSGVTKELVIGIAEIGRTFGSSPPYRPEPAPAVAAISDTGSHYVAGRTLSLVISFIGCIVAMMGAVAMGIGIFGEASPATRALLIYPGAGTLFAGLILLLAGQICRATVATAEDVRRILKTVNGSTQYHD